MVTQASTYLFEASKGRFYFRNVSILVPMTWKSKSEYLTPKQESYDKADVIVAEPYLKYGDDPYTLQYGQCGDRGQYIHFTPNFLLTDNLPMYGPRGRVFVHEWAHLRWGVFDEYNTDRPFYMSGKNTVEATRCSTGISGRNVVHDCQGGSCITRQCRRDSKTGLHEPKCTFIPNKSQAARDSIMFMQSLDSVVEFCTEKTHNTEAPNLQNKICNRRSTWDVIKESADFQKASPMTGREAPPPPTFSLLKSKQRVVCLVLDKSGSMDAAITSSNQRTSGSEIVLLTDGEDGQIGSCFEEVRHSGAIIHTIALGPDADRELKTLSTMTGGLHFYAGKDINGLIDAFSGISSRSGDISQQALQLESKALNITGKGLVKGTVLVDSTVGNDTFFVVTWMTQKPEITLQNPKGKKYTTSDFQDDKLNIRSIRLRIPGIAETGTWTYSLSNENARSQLLTLTVTTRARSPTVSPVMATAHMSHNTAQYPSPMIVYARVSQGFLPVLGASVTAVIEAEDGHRVTLELWDNGADQIILNPPRPEVPEATEASVKDFNRLTSGESFTVSGAPTGGDHAHVFPPSKVTDLEAEFKGDYIHLTWTAPGKVLDKGRAHRYVIRMSRHSQDLQEDFHNATLVNTSSLVPKEAGSKENFEFKPETLKIENERNFFLQGDRLIRMNQAAELYLTQIVEQKSRVGLVTFDSTAIIQNYLTEITNSNDYPRITANLPQQASGGTSICRGLEAGFQLESKAFNITGKGLVKGTVLVDSTVGNDTFFVVTWMTKKPKITLQDPKGKKYTISDFKDDELNIRSVRLQIPGIAE
ncbi:epithelial chloride channel protein, partial [Cricetulus griseus]